MSKDRFVQLVCVAVAAAALAGGAMLQRPLTGQRDQLASATVTSDAAIAARPYAAMLQLAPGGLRAVALNYLWIRSQRLKEQGRFYDAKQVRELICDMMPFHAGAWNFLSWDMAWNISVATHTSQERWTWVHNGITLIRDRGLIYNPDDLLLHKQIAWIFFAKIGDYTDEMHMVYKQRWAEQMDRVLGSPPLTGSRENVIAAFRLIAEAPEKLEQLLSDPELADYDARMKEVKLPADEQFILYYNRYSNDPLRGQLLPLSESAPEHNRPRIAELMTDPELAQARAKVLAFARRKVLTEHYKMDPQWMLKLMVKYGPLDWRGPHPHAIYWATMGLYRSVGLGLEDLHPASAEVFLREAAGRQQEIGRKLDLARMNRLSTQRVVLLSLRAMTHTGQMYYSYLPSPDRQHEPTIEVDWAPDWRFIESTHQEYLAAGAAMAGDPGRVHTHANRIRDGHVSFLTDAVLELYIGGREQDARYYYDEMKRLLKPVGDKYELDLRQFVWKKFGEDPSPSFDIARAFWYGALIRVYRAQASGNQTECDEAKEFAESVYKHFAEGVGRAPRFMAALQSFQRQQRNFLITMMLRPHALGLELPLVTKSLIYKSFRPRFKVQVYPFVAEQLKAECAKEGLDFAKAFPAPQAARPPGR